MVGIRGRNRWNVRKGLLTVMRRFGGYECGIVLEKFNDIKELDQIEAYIMVEVPR